MYTCCCMLLNFFVAQNSAKSFLNQSHYSRAEIMYEQDCKASDTKNFAQKRTKIIVNF